MNLLRRIELRLPDADPALTEGLLSFLAPFGRRMQHSLSFTPTDPDFLPIIDLSLDSAATASVTFLTDLGREVIEIINGTGQELASPHAYEPITVADFTSRMAPLGLAELDHVGFDLPWFEGAHPQILALRALLPNTCAYHRAFTGETWDLILPSTEAELAPTKFDHRPELDYGRTRRPKFEIVSLDKASTPILQFDFSVHAPYRRVAETFPEAIADPGLKNVWVYLDNGLGIDVCMVVNEQRTGDWSQLFVGQRL